MIQSKEQFFKAAPKRKELEIEIGDETMVFRELSVKDREEFFALGREDGRDLDIAAAFVLVRASDIFEDEDIKTLVDCLSPEALALTSHKILALSGMIAKAEAETQKK